MEVLIAVLALVLAPLIVEVLADPTRTVKSWGQLLRRGDSTDAKGRESMREEAAPGRR